MATETNGHTCKVIEATGEEHGRPDQPDFFYADCQHCDWHGEGRPVTDDDAEQEASAEGEGHETDLSFERPQMGGELPVLSEDPLVVLLYLLLRDRVHPGDLEQTLLGMERNPKLPFILSNGYIAGYAENIARRLRKVGAP